MSDTYMRAWSEAIYAHSLMESELCELFSALVECCETAGANIFYNMDYRRYKVISDIIQDKHSKHYKAWKKLQKWMVDGENSINKRRNNIVHWKMVKTADDFSLVNPRQGAIALLEMRYGQREVAEHINIDDLNQFTDDVHQMNELLNQFFTCILHPEYEKGFEVFLDVNDVRTPEDFENRIYEFRQKLEKKEKP